MRDKDQRDPVGSVADEAAKLLYALQAWAKESGSDYADTAAGAATGAAGAWRSLNEHIATGGQDCRYCPVCQVISTVRETSPEVRQHLASAANSFMQAIAGAMATHLPDQSGRSKDDSAMEKIDLSDDGDWEDD